MPDIITAYTGPISDWDDHHQVTVFPHARFTLGERGAANAPLSEMLWCRYDCDAHFTMYTGYGEKLCGKTYKYNGDLTFDVAAFDLDYIDHEEPPAGSFANLIRRLHVSDFTPNIVYETKHGARIIYCIKRITDPAKFEGHFQAFLKKLATPTDDAPSGHISGHGYKLDEAAKDWTRRFRCPHVVRDGVPMYHFHVREFHDRVMNLERFTYIPKAKPVYTGNANFDCRDPIILNRINKIVDGDRNNQMFAAMAYAYSKYKPADAEQWINRIVNAASAAGLTDHEIENTRRSAQNAAEKDKR
jgi:hypothetical protein